MFILVVIIFNITSGINIKTLTGDTSGVYSLVILPNGLLVSGSMKKVNIRNITTGITIKILTGHS